MTIDKPGFYKTRDGLRVRVLVTDAQGNHPIIGQYENYDGQWVTDSWCASGAYSLRTLDHPMDIVSKWEEPNKKMEAYLVKYEGNRNWELLFSDYGFCVVDYHKGAPPVVIRAPGLDQP